MTKEDQLQWRKPKKRKKWSKKTQLDRKLVGRNGAAGIWSRLIKLRARGVCEVCGSRENLNAHHIEGRRNRATRYDLRNGVSLCAGHHVMYKESAHESPIWFVEWLKVHRNADYYHIQTLRHEITEWSEDSLQEMYDEYIKLEKELNDKANGK